MSKLELNFSKDTETFRTFFGDEELQRENMKLYQVLVKSLKDVVIYGRVAILLFNNFKVVSIENIEENVYRMTLSDSTLYEYDDNPNTKLSKDRILYYLNYIGNVTILETK